MVSHELRTPLTSIKEGIGIVLDGSAGNINHDQKDFLAKAKKNVDRLHRFINDVLDFAKLESGRAEYRIAENDINAVIEDAVKTYKFLATEKGLYLKTELDSNMDKVEFDYDKILQVLDNLINNAVKFTDNGGITLMTAPDQRKHNIRITVKDTGVGIKEGDRKAVFAEFKQVTAGAYRKPGSTGLGLSIVKEIVNGHGGDIWVETCPGNMTGFVFTLPVKPRKKREISDGKT